MIVSGQLTREEAIGRLSRPPYVMEKMRDYDMNYVACYIGISRKEFEALLCLPPKLHTDYPCSLLNKLTPLARKLKKMC